jgi:diketogulonate reductase-like aldo/keto reductase
MGIVPFGHQLDISAWGYGNEIPLGNALQHCKTPRDQIFVTVHQTLFDS